MRSRVVLWGARRGDRQLGSPDDRRDFLPPIGGLRIALSHSMWPGLIGAVGGPGFMVMNTRTREVFDVVHMDYDDGAGIYVVPHA